MSPKKFLLALVWTCISLGMVNIVLARPFPVKAKRGLLTVNAYPLVELDGKKRRLSPGARIWNEHNLTMLPANLYGHKFTVNYTESIEGNIDRVWILTPGEIKQKLAS